MLHQKGRNEISTLKIDDLSFKTYYIAFLKIILIERATHVLSVAPHHPHLTPYQIALSYRILKFASDYDSTLLYPTSISSCRIYVLNSFLMGGKEISSRRCKCKWKPNCSNASGLQTLQRTNVTHIFISYIFEMLKVQNHECHESWKIQGVPEKTLL